MEKKKNKYEGFSLSMALVDAIPVIAFGASMIIIGMLFSSSLFIVGAVLCFFAGAAKVLWKILVATSGKDVKFLFMQMRYIMPCGFLIMILSLILNIKRVSLYSIFVAMFSIPSGIFFALWIIGMITMGVLAKKLDSSVAKNNWIEQCVNGVAQISLLIALLLLLK